MEIRRHLRYLRYLLIGELLNIPRQGCLWFVVAGLPITWSNAAGYIAFSALLLQGPPTGW